MMRSLLSEFRQFILRGNVVDLAVGIVIGVAFTGVVQALVRDFINRALILIIIGMTVFFLVVRPVNAMIDRFHLSPRSPSPATKTCPACFTDIPLKATRCPNCTSELAPPARDRAAARV